MKVRSAPLLFAKKMSDYTGSINSSSDVDVGGQLTNGNGVGLSDPQLSHGRRTMLDLVNRLHSTGYAIRLKFYL